MVWVLALSILATVVAARRSGWGPAVGRQAVAWLPALPLVVPGVLAWLGPGFPSLYRTLALLLVAFCQLALLFPERKAVPGSRRVVLVNVGWLLGAAVAPTVLAVLAFRHYLLFRYPGLGTPDDGLLFYAAKRLAEGGGLYRDVQYPSGAGMPVLLSLLYRLAGPSLPLGKGFLAVFAAFGAVATYLLGRKVTSSLVAFLAALATLSLPLPAGLSFALLAVAAAFMERWRRDVAWGVAGLLSGMAVIFDPLMGLLGAYALVVMLGVRQVAPVRLRVAPGLDLGLDWQTLTWYLAALALVLLPAACVLRYLPGTWSWMLADLRAHPWGSLQSTEIAATPLLPLVPGTGGWAGWQAAAERLVSVSGMVFCLLAGLVLLVRLAARQWREREFLVLTLVFMAGALTLRPVPGHGYLAPVYLLGAYVVGWAASALGKVLTGSTRPGSLVWAQVSGLILVAALWPLSWRFAGERAAWATPSPVEMSLVGVGTLSGGLQAPPAEANPAREVARRVQQVTRPGDPVLVLPCAPVLYFLCHRPAATRLAAPSPQDLDPPTVKELRRLVITGKVRALVLDVEEMGKTQWQLASLAGATGRMKLVGKYDRYRVWIPLSPLRPPLLPGLAQGALP